jgi:hypothetical protein
MRSHIEGKFLADDELTTIQIKKRTRNRLGSNGTKCESWDGIVNRLMDENIKFKDVNK